MGIADEKLALARKHLAKVQVAWLDPVDWADLSLYAFFALENAVVAAATHVGVPWKATHPDKVEAARINPPFSALAARHRRAAQGTE